MKQKVSPIAVVAVIVVVVGGVLFLGWRAISGGPNADVTSQNIQHWQSMRDQATAASHSKSIAKPADAAKYGAPIGAAPTGK